MTTAVVALAVVVLLLWVVLAAAVLAQLRFAGFASRLLVVIGRLVLARIDQSGDRQALRRELAASLDQLERAIPLRRPPGSDERWPS